PLLPQRHSPCRHPLPPLHLPAGKRRGRAVQLLTRQDSGLLAMCSFGRAARPFVPPKRPPVAKRLRTPGLSSILGMKGGNAMQIEIKLDPSCTEPKVTVTAAAMDETVRQIVDRLQEAPPQVLTGLREDKWQVLAPEDLIRLYAAAGKVYAVTAQGEYSLRLRLYELEERLDPRRFVRISHSEIVNRTRSAALTSTWPAPSALPWPTAPSPMFPAAMLPRSKRYWGYDTMKKKLLSRAAAGAIAGLAISYAITILLSL